jgi:DNA-binding CsgD family transcriptional regulator
LVLDTVNLALLVTRDGFRTLVFANRAAGGMLHLRAGGEAVAADTARVLHAACPERGSPARAGEARRVHLPGIGPVSARFWPLPGPLTLTALTHVRLRAESIERALRRLHLSHRQVTVAALAVSGLPNSDIAARLSLRVATVKAYLTAVYDLLGVDGRTGLEAAVREIAEATGPPGQGLR